MKTEVQSAVEFITKLLKTRTVTANKAGNFNESLENVLCSHYQDHWFPAKPFKGSAYRCMRIVNRKMDPLISKAGALAGLTDANLLDVLPSELTLWVDPEEVSYRFGEDGSIGILYESPTNGTSSTDSSDSDSAASLSSSPSLSQEYIPSFSQQVCMEQMSQQQHHQQSQRYPDHFSGPCHTQDVPMSHWEYLSTFVAS